MIHKDLIAWQKAVELVIKVYKVTSALPGSEKFGLVSQMRRAAISIPSNIAEGSGRHTSKELSHFLYIALGSLSELETQLIISEKLGYLSTDNLQNLVKEISILRLLISALNKSIINKIKARK